MLKWKVGDLAHVVCGALPGPCDDACRQVAQAIIKAYPAQAAAPALLEALRPFAELDRAGFDEGAIVTLHVRYRTVRAASIAIAQAEGREAC